MAKRSQTGDVLAHLIKYGKITTYEANKKYGCTRLPARIFDFRAKGYDIETERAVVKNRYGNPAPIAIYRLKATPEAAV